jgi:6-hydroxytryprostatin B O-methyltransferase
MAEGYLGHGLLRSASRLPATTDHQQKDKYEHLCYYMIYQFNIHRSVPLDGDISYEELSQACNIPVDALTRLLRHAMLHRLFIETRSGYVAHSEASRIFVTDPPMASWLGHNYDEVFRSLTALPDALRKYPAASDPGHTAAALTFNQPRGLFGGLLQEEPWRAVRFAEAMQALTRGSYDPSHLVDGYDWGKHAGGLIVDVST